MQIPNVGNVQGLIDRLKVIGEEIKQLENKKQLAVENEDYDTAKSCKVIRLLSLKSLFFLTVLHGKNRCLVRSCFLFLTFTRNWVL
jgi:hypothetical protein